MKHISGLVWLIGLVILSYFSIVPLFVSGFFPMHDNTQVARVYEMTRSLINGMFPVRWVTDLGYGYGYPIFTFYGPFAYYLGSIPMLLGANALLATKIMFGIGIISSGVGMYYLSRIFWGNSPAIVASLLYLFAPYHAVTIYVRGAVGEFFGYAIIPFVFYGLIKTYKDGAFRYFAIFSVSLALLIASHNLTALMLVPFLFTTILVAMIYSLKQKKVKQFYFLLLGSLLAVGLSAFYWLPALFEMSSTNVLSQIGGGADFRDHFVCPQQLWSSPWGFAGSAKGCLDGLSFQLGKLHWFIVVVSIPIIYLLFNKQKERAIILGGSLFFFILSLFLLLPDSLPFWNGIPQMSFIQYPWRFLMFASFFSSFLGGGVVWYLVSREIVGRAKILGIVIPSIVFLLIVSFYSRLFVPQTVLRLSSSDYTSINMLRWTTSKVSDEYLPRGFQKPKMESDFPLTPFILTSGDGNLLNQTESARKYSVDVHSLMPRILLARIAPFPAWRGSVDGQRVSLQPQNDGYLISLPAGSHKVVISYEETTVEQLADVISLISIVMLLTGIIITERKGTL